jgi:hypothetical protein
MFLAPYFMMLILNGLQLTIQVIKSTKVVKSLLLSLFFLEFVPFTASAYGEMKDRSNKISQSVMNNIVETYHPDAILGCKSRCYDFYLLNLDGYNNQPKWCVYSLLLKNGTSSFKSGDKIVVMSNVKIEGSDVYKSIELIENDIFSDFLSNYTLSLISSEESVTNCAPYYASKYYNVTSNGSCIYVYEISEKE